jgi:hypothetical protein
VDEAALEAVADGLGERLELDAREAGAVTSMRSASGGADRTSRRR